jgi:uncharacterized lipoprotein YajG
MIYSIHRTLQYQIYCKVYTVLKDTVNKRGRPVKLRIAWILMHSIIILIALIGISGCTHMATPTVIPSVEDNKDTRFAGSAVSLSCLETDTTDQYIGGSYSNRGEFYGNKKLWCDKLTLALSNEIVKRGAIMANGERNRFEITIPEINAVEGIFTFGFKAKAVIKSDSGCSKAYEGTNSVHAGLQSVGDASIRAANYTIYDVIKAILDDSEFTSQVKGYKK